MKLIRFGVLALAASLPACYDFHFVGPEDPAPVKLPNTVSVTISYLRPVACVNTSSRCDGPVMFHASWMKLGTGVALEQTAAHHWTAILPGVPVNFPGNEPYRVYAVDPFLLDSPTGGISADRLTIGGEKIVQFENPGNPREQGLILIDANGRGRTPQR
jgi:hypothetical protein